MAFARNSVAFKSGNKIGFLKKELDKSLIKWDNKEENKRKVKEIV